MLAGDGLDESAKQSALASALAILSSKVQLMGQTCSKECTCKHLRVQNEPLPYGDQNCSEKHLHVTDEMLSRSPMQVDSQPQCVRHDELAAYVMGHEPEQRCVCESYVAPHLQESIQRTRSITNANQTSVPARENIVDRTEREKDKQKRSIIIAYAIQQQVPY